LLKPDIRRYCTNKGRRLLEITTPWRIDEALNVTGSAREDDAREREAEREEVYRIDQVRTTWASSVDKIDSCREAVEVAAVGARGGKNEKKLER
jgi:hypothetical protein